MTTMNSKNTKRKLLDLLTSDPDLIFPTKPGEGNIIQYRICRKRQDTPEIYFGHNKPSAQLQEFCFIMDRLVEEEAVHIVGRTEFPALIHIICKYILEDERDSARIRAHNYAIYMRRLIGWRVLI